MDGGDTVDINRKRFENERLSLARAQQVYKLKNDNKRLSTDRVHLAGRVYNFVGDHVPCSVANDIISVQFGKHETDVLWAYTLSMFHL